MNNPILSADHVVRTFTVNDGGFGRSARLTAVNGVSLQVMPQAAIGIAGESGCGKSTLARLLTGLLPPTTGTISFGGKPLAQLNATERRAFHRTVQMVFQDPYSSLNPRMRIGQIIGEPLQIHRLLPKSEQAAAVRQLLDAVGLPVDATLRYPHEFSGGQRQRIGIARALAVTPQVLIADEPVSALDLSIQAQIINLLQELRQRYNLALVLIAHDLSVIRHLCDTVAIMYLGEIVEFGPCDQVFTATRHPYTEALLAAIPHLDTSTRKRPPALRGDLPSPIDPPPGCRFHPRCPYAEDLCRQQTPALTASSGHHAAACHFSSKLLGKDSGSY